MKKTLFFLFTALISCSQTSKQKPKPYLNILKSEEIDSLSKDSIRTVKNVFSVLSNTIRTNESDSSFASYLRTLPLKPEGSQVKYYNNEVKWNKEVYAAVIDLPIGNKNLHQCADALIRLRAEYLWLNKREDEIHFNFTNGFQVDYAKWKKGYRVKVQDNNCTWVKSTIASNDYNTFWRYMETLFNYAGTMSLSKEMSPISMDSMKIGDVLIQGGFPGHAVIVVDMLVDTFTDQKYYMLAQSYMPAQELQILYNNNEEYRTVWYKINNHNSIRTPEWEFTPSNLKRFKK